MRSPFPDEETVLKLSGTLSTPWVLSTTASLVRVISDKCFVIQRASTSPTSSAAPFFFFVFPSLCWRVSLDSFRVSENMPLLECLTGESGLTESLPYSKPTLILVVSSERLSP